jgi:hypothetical protein
MKELLGCIEREGGQAKRGGRKGRGRRRRRREI